MKKSKKFIILRSLLQKKRLSQDVKQKSMEIARKLLSKMSINEISTITGLSREKLKT